MTTTVSLDTREDFEKEIKTFMKDLRDFLDGKGEMPTTNTEVIKAKYVKIGEEEMVGTGTPKYVAKRVSNSTFSTLLEKMVS